MWQKCPICNGVGGVFSRMLQINEACSTCNGTKIISELTGLPPVKSMDTVSQNGGGGSYGLPKKKEPLVVDLIPFLTTSDEDHIYASHGKWGETLRVLDNVHKTYKKYMFEEGREDIIVKTSLIPPQTYKTGSLIIKIIN